MSRARKGVSQRMLMIVTVVFALLIIAVGLPFIFGLGPEAVMTAFGSVVGSLGAVFDIANFFR